jgi:Tat protein translocase TatB subunit
MILMDFFGIGAGELLVIIIIALILIGPAKIPGAARTIGRTINKVKKASSELTSQVNKELQAGERQLSESKSDIIETFKQPVNEDIKTSISPDDKPGLTLGK